MTIMNEAEFVAHALSDYLNTYIPRAQFATIHNIIISGEPLAGIGFALGVASENSVGIPQLLAEKIMSLNELTLEEKKLFELELSSLPVFQEAA